MKIFKSHLSKYFLFLMLLLLNANSALAAASPSPAASANLILPGPKTNYAALDAEKSKSFFMEAIFGNTFSFIEKLASALAVILIMYQSVLYIMAGTPEKAKTAKQALISSVIGIGLIAAAYTFINIALRIADSVGSLG